MIPFLTHSLCTNRQNKAQSQDEIVVPVNFLKRCPKYWKRGPLRSCWRLLNWLMEHRDNVQFPFECTACVIASYTYCMDIFHWITEKLRSGTGGVVNPKEREYFNINLKLIQCTYVWFGNNYFIQSDIFGSILSYRLPIDTRHYGHSYGRLCQETRSPKNVSILISIWN